jgi:hypothetical protein
MHLPDNTADLTCMDPTVANSVDGWEPTSIRGLQVRVLPGRPSHQRPCCSPRSAPEALVNRLSTPYLQGTAKTKREAQARRARLLSQADEDKRPATDATLARLLERWLEMADLAWKLPGQGSIERTILPTLGHLPLRRLDTATLDRCYSELGARGGVGAGRWRRPLSARSRRSWAGRWIRGPAGAGFPPTRRPGEPTRLGSAEI